MQKVFVDSSVKDFAGNFLDWGIKSCYGTFISYFRIPTFIRKEKNKQTLTYEWKPKHDNFSKDAGRFFGGVVGAAGGIIGDVGFQFILFILLVKQ